MILGVGSDLIRIDRLAGSIDRFGERFLKRVFTPGEIRQGEELSGKAAIAFYAKRFAAKEAAAKALGTGMRDGIWFTQIEVENDSLGRPSVNVSGAAADLLAERGGEKGARLHLTLSDEREFALAFVVLEKL